MKTSVNNRRKPQTDAERDARARAWSYVMRCHETKQKTRPAPDANDGPRKDLRGGTAGSKE